MLQETDYRDELLGALGAIGWLAPSGGFPAPPRPLRTSTGLANDSTPTIRGRRSRALTALGSHWQQPDLGG